MKILFGPPVAYDEDGEVVAIKHLIYVEDFDMPTLIVPILATGPKLLIGSEKAPERDLIRQVEYRLREINDEGIATYEFVRYQLS